MKQIVVAAHEKTAVILQARYGNLPKVIQQAF